MEPDHFFAVEPAVVPTEAAATPRPVDGASIAVLEEELGAIEAELHALDHVPD